MSKNINNWFKEQDFNVAPLPQGHRERFLELLDAATQSTANQKKSGKIIAFMHWQKWAVAASIIVLLGIGFMSMPRTTSIEQVSPQMAASQDMFTKTIDAELLKLEKQQSPETERIIADTKKNLAKLEKDYLSIAKDFKANSNTAVMESMLLNFKTRVALLETALEHINDLKEIKKQHHETLL